jgi:hypothetical protein
MSFVAAVPLLPIAAALVLAGVILGVVVALRRAPAEVPGFVRYSSEEARVVPMPAPPEHGSASETG